MLSSLLQVPNDYFNYKGTKSTDKKGLVLEYMESIPRHFSHYSLSSLHEYIDCASSIFNWYKGPTDINEDGSISPCFLKWLDDKMGTTNYDFYQMYHFYDGVSCNRDYVHLLFLPNHMLPTRTFTVLLVSSP